MILPRDRRLAALLIRLRIWKLTNYNLFNRPDITPSWGTRWLFERMKKRQTRDGLHHAPGCAGNEWSGAKLVFQACTCGARR